MDNLFVINLFVEARRRKFLEMYPDSATNERTCGV